MSASMCHSQRPVPSVYFLFRREPLLFVGMRAKSGELRGRNISRSLNYTRGEMRWAERKGPLLSPFLFAEWTQEGSVLFFCSMNASVLVIYYSSKLSIINWLFSLFYKRFLLIFLPPTHNWKWCPTYRSHFLIQNLFFLAEKCNFTFFGNHLENFRQWYKESWIVYDLIMSVRLPNKARHQYLVTCRLCPEASAIPYFSIWQEDMSKAIGNFTVDLPINQPKIMTAEAHFWKFVNIFG